MMTQSEVPVNASQSDLRILWIPAFLCALLLAVEVYFLLHDWNLMGRAKTANVGDPIAVYVSGKKMVRQKTVGTLVWEVPTSNMPLFRQSEIATSDDSEAVLKFNDQSELIVEPNSLLILEEAPTALTTGHSGKFVARLVKGSVKRKNSGATPFFMKLSQAPEAAPVQIKDTRGDSVFRVIYRVTGYEIVVESGSVVVNEKDSVAAGQSVSSGEAPKLTAPILNKAKVEIIRDEEEPTPKKKKSSGVIFWNKLFPSARAAEPSKLAIHFSWEATPGATAYQIQIAKDTEFKEILLDKKVEGQEYLFKMVAPKVNSELYFRVAGISGKDVVGDFSSVEKVDVKPDVVPVAKVVPTPEPTPEPIAKIEPTPKPTPVITPAPIVEVRPAPAPVAQTVAKEIYVPPKFVNTGNTGWVWYGAEFDQRTFKTSASLPNDTSGGGFIPSVFGFEFQHARDPGHYYSVGGTFAYEKASASLPSPSDTAFSTSSVNLWLTYGQLFDWWEHPQTLHFGPFMATSRKVTTNGLQFNSQNTYLFGLIAAIQSDPAIFKRKGSFSWRAQLAALFAGAVGVDFSAWLRKPVNIWGVPNGLFYGGKVGTRQSTAESSYEAALELGVEI